MGGPFIVHTSNRQEVLLEHLAARLRSEPLAPLQDETILVPGRALARWLRLQLAQQLGIAASLDLPSPMAFLQRIACAGRQQPATEGDRFAPDTLALRVFRLLGDGAGQRELQLAVGYCRDDPDQRKRWQLAERTADCLHQYQLFRPAMLRAWARGEDGGIEHPHARWQAHLWRQLVQESGGVKAPALPEPGMLPFAGGGPAVDGIDPHLIAAVQEALADPHRAAVVLPARLAVFGLPALPPALVAVLQQIARTVPVTVYLLLPTDQYFGDIQRPRGEAAEEPDFELLARLGRQARETFDVLLDADPHGAAIEPLEFVDPGTDRALWALQSDLLRLQGRGGAKVAIDDDDRSVCVHGCHSPMREMQVLRDQILDAMERDPTLRPGDVLVLMPDIKGYAPYVQAVFGPLRDRLPFTIADRSPALRQPLLATLLRVLELARHRPATADILHLLEEPSLLRRFGLSVADTVAARDFLGRTRTRIWEADPQAPAGLGSPHSFGLARQRLLFGVATGPLDDLVGGVLPEADATDARAAVLGRLLDLVDALAERLAALGRPHPAPGWADELEGTLAALFLPQTAEELAAAEHVAGCARALRVHGELAGLREELSPVVLRELVDRWLQSAGEAGGLFTGSVTFAALKPMRAVPAELLCISGLGDEAFPHRDRPLPFDLMAALRRPGDRSPRDEDRHLFLEALLSARRQLVLTFVARSQKDDSPCAPSTVLAELLDHLERSCAPKGDHTARDHFALQHPLQSFSRRYREDPDERLFTYAAPVPGDAEPLGDATAPFVGGSLPADSVGRAMGLEELCSFWRSPAKAFCRTTLQLSLPWEDDRPDDAEPFALHRLDQYHLENDAVGRALAEGIDPQALDKALQRGLLPTRSLGPVAFASIAVDSAVFGDRIGTAPERSPEIELQIGDFTVRGSVPLDASGAPLLWRVATVKAKDRVVAWLHHLFFNAAAEARGTDLRDTRVLGTRHSLQFRAPTPPLATEWLAALLRATQAGRGTPLPFFPESSYAYRVAVRMSGDHEDAVRRAQKPWRQQQRRDGSEYDGEGGDAFVRLCWRDRDPFQHPDFSRLAELVFEPMIGLEDKS